MSDEQKFRPKEIDWDAKPDPNDPPSEDARGADIPDDSDGKSDDKRESDEKDDDKDVDPPPSFTPGQTVETAEGAFGFGETEDEYTYVDRRFEKYGRL